MVRWKNLLGLSAKLWRWSCNTCLGRRFGEDVVLCSATEVMTQFESKRARSVPENRPLLGRAPVLSLKRETESLLTGKCVGTKAGM
jgi:hypothetical protein